MIKIPFLDLEIERIWEKKHVETIPIKSVTSLDTMLLIFQ